MTRDEIIGMAREVGFDDFEQDDMIERFAALVIAAEREACAQSCIEVGAIKGNSDDALDMADACAAAIRARGEK